ncbi:MAG: response regulator receiver protein [Myxococcales bacterium]|nr:response regulator receiver protein [Myxococcales bacterium]
MESEAPRGLLIAEDAKTVAMLQRVASAAQFPLRWISTVDEIAAEQIADYSLLVLGESVLGGAVGSQVELLRRGAHPSLRIAVVDESQDRRAALDRILVQHADHLIPAGTSEDVLFATLRKLGSGTFFGLERYLLPGVNADFWTLGSSDEKTPVLDQLRASADRVNCHPRITDLLLSAVDEMIINAIYRPVPSAETTGRSVRPVTVACATDGRFLAVSVRDEHGLFRHEDLIRAIRKALVHEERGIAETAVHASLGFRLMLAALSHLAINVEPGRRTEIIGLVDLRLSLKEYRSAVPGLGMFT